MVWLGGLGSLVVWDSNRDTPKNSNSLYISGIQSESQNHRALQTTNATFLPENYLKLFGIL